MNDLTEKTKEEACPQASEGKPGGRLMFSLLALVSGLLLLAIGSQTEPGMAGGGWWNEPRNAPLLSLSILFVFSLLSAISAAPSAQRNGGRETFISILMTSAFLGAVWLIPFIGYGLSVLLFCLIAAISAGFKGRQLALVVIGLTLFMLIMFRYILGLWFPAAQLFDLIPGLGFLGGYL
ncbi:tripartite tricarboxylate transporter TctB family protein [Marinobacterium sp. YM272]|uniref:tripartite tricarboxylate transporter TctB family protein n=1 Tax=Marinobacterium sp. YM272 TaxID=3421654 RepID=UPI003D7FA7DD